MGASFLKKRWIFCAAVLLLLTACGAQTEQAAEEPPAETETAQDGGTEDAVQAAPSDLLPGLDLSALEASMPGEDYAAFETYLPVLRGEQAFRWVEGPYDGYECGWEPFDADMTAVHDQLWSGFGGEIPEKLTLDRLAVQDIDGDGAAELVLLFQDGAYNYLVLHREGEKFYGTRFYVRWFEGLQKNGVYWGAGGAGYSTYCRMSFQNDHFEEQELGRSIDGAHTCYRELDGREVTKEAFDAWYAENMVGDVAWYAPGGAVIPEDM